MKKRYSIIITLALCIFLMIPQVVNACWAYLTVEEMVEQSDVILVGEILGNEGKAFKDKQMDINYIKWKVQPQYVIKGELEDSTIAVVTPGEGVSIHYNLDEQGNKVILFLRNRENKDNKGKYYEPLSPQGVVGIDLTKEEVILEEPFSGDQLMKKIQITNGGFGMDPKEKREMEEYISNIPTVKVVKETAENSAEKRHGRTALIFVGGWVLCWMAIEAVIIHQRKK